MADKLTMKSLDTRVKNVERVHEEFMDCVSSDFVTTFQLYDELSKKVDQSLTASAIAIGITCGVVASLLLLLFV